MGKEGKKCYWRHRERIVVVVRERAVGVVKAVILFLYAVTIIFSFTVFTGPTGVKTS